MITGTNEALALTFVMGVVILFCRAFPFLFLREPPVKGDAGNGGRGKTGGRAAFLNFVEKTVPPVAMTVLAVNSLAGPLKGNFREGIPILSAACLTALLQLWKRNPLISIFGGTVLYMILERSIMR
ncbi:MAG: AzlD domain-containing protein [Treponema sp.]|jgi:branched-subunit amino acid transport protein AzlD|nr:AzlD domain-containing protein [Treponema sp.]